MLREVWGRLSLSEVNMQMWGSDVDSQMLIYRPRGRGRCIRAQTHQGCRGDASALVTHTLHLSADLWLPRHTPFIFDIFRSNISTLVRTFSWIFSRGDRDITMSLIKKKNTLNTALWQAFIITLSEQRFSASLLNFKELFMPERFLKWLEFTFKFRLFHRDKVCLQDA